MLLAIKPKSSLLLKATPWFGFYGTIGLILAGDLAIINAGEELEGFTRHLVVSLYFVIFTAFIADKKYRKILFGQWGLCYGIILSIYSIIGLIQGNDAIFFKSDIVILGWLIGGLALFRLMIKLPNPSLHLLIFILLGTFIIHYSQIVAIANPSTQLEYGGRIIDQNNILFHYSALLIVPTGISLSIFFRKGVIWIFSLISLIALHFYNGAFLSGTRSIALYLILVLIFCSINLTYTVNQGILTLKRSKYAKFIASAIILMVVVGLATFTGNLFSEQNILAQRTVSATSVADESTLMRIIELSDALSQLNELQFIIGGGVGHTFETILSGDKRGFLHIGIFTFLLKGGIILLAMVALFLYMRLPLLFLAGWLKPLSFSPRVRTAILVVLPGIFGWIFLLTVSGGYDHYNFLGVGFGFGAFLHICEHGLDKFFPSSKYKN